MPDHPISVEETIEPAALLELIEGSAPDLITLCTVRGFYIHVSDVAGSMLGWQPAEMLGRSVDDFVHPDDRAASKLARAAALRSPDRVVTEQRMRLREGGHLWTEVAMRQVADPRQPDHTALIASIRDIAGRKLVEARLERLAMTDPLTGVANRTVLIDRLTHALQRLERHGRVLAVIYLDLDRFKVINDSLGHKLGDQLLTRVADRAVKVIRPEDTLARFGGDEFVIVAEDLSDLSQATGLAERVRTAMAEPFDLSGESVVCTVSAGVATASAESGQNAQGLLQEADLALYRAKNRGRNRVEVFDEDLRTTAVGRLGVERMLRRAIHDDRLRVHYQPIIDLRTGRTTGAEALVRIEAERDLILPGEFIAVAEETGLLVTIDEWMLRQVVAQAAAWMNECGEDFEGVSLNITARHLAGSRFASVLHDMLANQGLSARTLSVEVTERVLMEASSSAIDGLRTVRALGVGVGLDDFGTGYSSLAYLRQCPLDFVKIDGSFVAELGGKSEEVAIVNAIIGLAHALHLKVIAEGVETEEQRRILTGLGCDRAQGFLFSPAVPAASITEFIKRGSGLAS